MKSLICSLVFIFSFIFSYGQFGITQNLGNANTLVQVPANGGLRAGLINRVFFDTTSANLSQLDFYDGSQIKTLSPNALWWRDSSYMAWRQVLPAGGGSGGGYAWVIGGNTWANDVDDLTFGARSSNRILFKTRDLTRVVLDSTGLGLLGSVSDTAANKVMTFNPTTKAWNYGYWYGSGGGGGSGWSLTGNASTVAGTNFIGTTDNVGLMFKVNNVQAGYIDIVNGNTSLGENSLTSNTTGGVNVAIGYNSANAITGGVGNVAIGASTLSAVTNGGDNTAIGEGSLSISTSSGNIAVGAHSGRYLTSESNRLIFNSLNRTNKLGDTTKAIIYGAQDATAANQRLYLNSQVYLPYAASGVGTKALRIDTITGLITYADTTAGGGTPSLTQYRIAVGNASNQLSDNAAITANRALISDANGVPTHATTTATQVGYLSSATGTTGTASTNVVFSTSPTLTTPTFATSAIVNNNTADGTALMVSDANRSLGGTAQTTAMKILGSATPLNNLLHMDNNQATGRAGFTLSNSASTGDWANNHMGMLVNGASFASNYYITNIPSKTSDAGYSYLYSQGNATQGLGILNVKNVPIWFGMNNTAYALMYSTRNGFAVPTYFGDISTTATAKVHIAAGTASANTAPLKFTSGTNLTTAEAGAVEYNGTDLFYTNSTPTRRTVANLDAAQTFTNKRWTARVGSTTSSATPTINTDDVDIYKLTAQAADITSFTTNLSGTPGDGDILEIQVTGTAARAITWGASFVSSTVTLPTTTVTTATLTVILQYYTTSSYGNNKWVCVNYY